MKTALVTGSSKGIGKQIAIDFLKEGYFVFLNYGHDDLTANDLKDELKLISNNFKILKNDFSTKESIENFCSEILSSADEIDVLVLNAGATNRKNLDTITFEEWSSVMMTNLNAPFYIIKLLKEKIKYSGNIIFIGSILGIYSHAMSIPYAVSKAGLHMLAKSLIKEFCEEKIRVNVIAPGFVDTPWQKAKPQEQRKRIEDKTALKRFAKVEEISNAVQFVVNNGFVNGAILSLDGGYCYK